MKKPEENLFLRLFCLFSLLIFFCFFSRYIGRDLWFDEALTLLNFASMSNAAEIYQSYFIPNNQIIHSCFLHYLIHLGIPMEFLRLFPLLCAGITVYTLWKNFSREFGRIPLAIALAALIISPPFMLYASALRGYMLAAMFSACALTAAKHYLLRGKKRYLTGWFISAVLAVGVMPSALAGIAAAGLYAAPYGGKKFLKNRKIWFLALSSIAGFILFYFPIADKLLKAFELKEGWQNVYGAILAVVIAVVLTFAVPLVSGIFYHRRHLRNWLRTIIWFIPLISLFFPVAPFPRVWFVLFPVFTLLAAGFISHVPGKQLKIIAGTVLLWGSLICSGFIREHLSPAVTLGGQDDFYAPRFTRTEFVPSDTARFLRQNFPGHTVFISFDADPWAVMIHNVNVVFDGPRGRTRQLYSGMPVVLSIRENPEIYADRFNGSLIEIYCNGLHRIYIFQMQ